MRVWRSLSLLALLGASNSLFAQIDPLGINQESDRYGRYASIAITQSGFPLIAYEGLFGSSGLMITLCEDDACEVATNRLVDPRGSANAAGLYSRILIPQSSKPVIVHTRLSANGVRVVNCASSNCLQAMGASDTLTSVGTTGYVPGAMDAALGADGFPVISVFYQDAGTPQGLWIVKCSDLACSGPIVETRINAARPESGRVNSIEVGSDGFPIVAFQDRTSVGSNGNVVVMKCNDPACAGLDESFSEIAPYSSSDRALDLKVRDDGLPVVAFPSIQSQFLVALCNDPACQGGDEEINAVSVQAAVGFSVAMDLSAEGFPLLAVHGSSSSTGSAQLYACNDAACSGGDERTLAVIDSQDSDVSFGRYLGISSGLDGLPLLLYSRVENLGANQFARSLRLLDCYLIDCVPMFSDDFETTVF